MRKRLLTLALAVLAVLPTAWAYDFSATSPSGHTLYYEIISGTTNVGVVRPGTGSAYNNYVTGNVVIPATVVYNNTTYNVTELRSIYDVSSGYDYGSFESCSGLTSVTIPNSVTSIGSYAFYNCRGLTSVTIPNSVTSIGFAAFEGCTGLTSVTIPNSITSIGDYAFSLVRNIIYNGSATGSPWGALCVNGFVENGFVYSDSTKTALKGYIGTDSSVTIPNSVTSIGYAAFSYCSGLTSVTIGNSVTSIEDYAFYSCSGLTSVTIPNSVTSIENGTFYGCSGLTTLNFNAINCGDFSSGSYHPFYNCPIATINIGDSVQRIPAYFAYDLESLTSVIIGNSVTSIGNAAFSGCSGLTSVTIPNSVTSIGNYAFTGCSGLTTLNFNAINCSDFTYEYYSEYPPFYGCPISTINIGDSVQQIPAYFAYNLDSLISVTIPNSVTSIGGSAFSGCSSLVSVSISNNIDTIRNSTFEYCSSLSSIIIPNNVRYIGDKAFYRNSNLRILNFNAINCDDFTNDSYHPFYECPISVIVIGDSVMRIPVYFAYNLESLTSVTIGNSVTSIGNYAFRYCSGLTSITIPNSVTTIGKSAFTDCGHLASATISSGINRIQESTFENCTSLVTITIPSNVANIEDKAFNGCSSLHEVISLAVLPPSLGEEIFSATAILKVPCGSADYYNSAASDWTQYFVGIEEICNVTITVTSANENMGTVSGGGEYEVGTEITITATPNQGYRFVSWNDGNTDNPRTITVTEDATYIANFAEEGEEVIRYTITVLSANENMGTVSGGGEYEFGEEVTITAIPNEGYRFVSWNDGNTDNPRTITVTEDATYIAIFEESVGIESRDMLSELAFYPNPTSGIITFNRSDIMKVEVLDAMGRTVEVYENAYTIDISKLAKGYYAMRITTPEGVAVRKVIRK